MAKKKNKSASVSQEDNVQAQQVLEHYHQVAQNLRLSTDQKQAESALTEINNMSEGAQVALLKVLAKEHQTDAADVLLAINELSPLKNVRKEARRSLIQLEGARIYPRWHPPVQQPFALQVTDTPLHFWKGIVTDSLDVGEVQLVLAFEQGADTNEIRVLGFLLEFLHDGVKDFFTRIESKRGLENFITQMSTGMGDIQTKECSLAEGRRLLLDALAVNKKYGTLPHKDYRYNLSLVNRLVLEAPDLDEDADLDEEDEESIDLHGLEPQAVVINFIESWINGEYDIAYDLLSSDSALREGLSREEWIERRETWAEEADPGDLEPDFIHEREPRESKLWLPNQFSAREGTTRKEIDVGWSIELDQTSLSETLPEFPQATAIYEETDRHWFWTSYTLIQEQEEWRIQSMTDEGANALALPVAELQKRVQEHDKYLQESTQELPPADIDEEEAELDLSAILWHLMAAVYYTDALIKELPLDRSLYLEAAGRLVLIHKYERAIVYLEPLARRFTEERAEVLRQLAAVEIELSKQYFEEKEDDERAERFQELAEEALRESLAIEDSFEAHLSLAELLLDDKERLDEAEDHLLRAKTMVSEPSEEAHIELHLGEIAMEREQYEEALSHYQHVAEHDPGSAEAWFDIAEAHNKLGNFAEAEANYKRAIELEPDNENYYIALSEMYIENQQGSKAIELIEEAIEDNPDSATLYVALASIYLRNEDYHQAAIFIAKAERIDPESPDVQLARQVLTLAKAMQAPNFTKLDRPKKKRKR